MVSLSLLFSRPVPSERSESRNLVVGERAPSLNDLERLDHLHALVHPPMLDTLLIIQAEMVETHVVLLQVYQVAQPRQHLAVGARLEIALEHTLLHVLLSLIHI